MNKKYCGKEQKEIEKEKEEKRAGKESRREIEKER